jgi:hypothetical protein
MIVRAIDSGVGRRFDWRGRVSFYVVGSVFRLERLAQLSEQSYELPE